MAAIVALTLVTQIGGLVLWPVVGLASTFPPRRRWLGGLALFVALYAAASVLLVPPTARVLGRVPLPCFGDAHLQPRSMFFCAANRHYVVPPLRVELRAVATRLAAMHPDAHVAFLDAGFPFPGLPLLPHLSHGDGRKVDLALPFVDPETGAAIDGGGSPIGYFGYIAPSGPPACPRRLVDLRWDFDRLQPLFGPPRLDEARTRSLIEALVERPTIGKLFLEPHLRDRLGVSSSKIRFQGCHAARHDDHIHVQL
ncbi:MAG: hypothetical protein AAF968_12940 [Pseudomonadota bacterium]